MLIQVTEADIREGKKRICRDCPVARAINKVLTNNLTATVAQFYIDIYNGINLIKRYTCPKDVRTFIEKYDMNWIVEPFEFELPIEEFCK